MSAKKDDVTSLLQNWSGGDPAAEEELFAAVYDELRRIADGQLRKERSGHTLQPTELVHEAFLRLRPQRGADWRNRQLFFAIASRMMRRVLVDLARRRDRQKRGGRWRRLTLDTSVAAPDASVAEVLAVDQALCELERVDELKARIVEMKIFAGMTVAEMAELLGCSERSVARHWQMAKALMSRELTPSS